MDSTVSLRIKLKEEIVVFFFYASSYQLFEMIISLKYWQKSAGTKHCVLRHTVLPQRTGLIRLF